MASNVKNTADLRRVLLEVIEEVRNGKTSYQDASAISGLASSVLKSAKLDFDVSRKQTNNEDNEIQAVSLLIGVSPQETTKQIEGESDDPLYIKIKSLKERKKTLGQIQDELKPVTQDDRKRITEIFTRIK